MTLTKLSESYIRLAHRLEKHRAGVVDAHYGKATRLKAQTDLEPLYPLEKLADDASEILSDLSHTSEDPSRAAYLRRQTEALNAMIEKERGMPLTFRDEAARCLGITQLEKVDVQPILTAMENLDDLLPGSGSLTHRYTTWRKNFELVGDEVLNFINAAMHEMKTKTESLFPLPENDVAVSLVRDKPWAGYHWYKGNFTSLYELNIDVPTTIWNVLHTTTHEAFCGHHTEAILKEALLVHEKGYDEFSVSLLGTPCSTLSEGIAEAALSLVIGETDAVIDWLQANEPIHGRRFTAHDADIFRCLEAIGRNALINASLMIHDENASDSTVFDYLRQLSPNEDALLHHTIARLRDEHFRAYMLTYPIGKTMVMNELHRATDKPKTFFNILSAVDYRFHEN
jgi:hypothetical protein